ncbi:MAG: hypothetical protein ABEJ93_02095 [Candidatus Nanohalobium sp.]
MHESLRLRVDGEENIWNGFNEGNWDKVKTGAASLFQGLNNDEEPSLEKLGEVSAMYTDGLKMLEQAVNNENPENISRAKTLFSEAYNRAGIDTEGLEERVEAMYDALGGGLFEAEQHLYKAFLEELADSPIQIMDIEGLVEDSDQLVEDWEKSVTAFTHRGKVDRGKLRRYHEDYETRGSII